MKTCSVSGCYKPARVRGWCVKHYARWKRHGDVNTVLQERNPDQGCSIEGCDNPHMGRGWCAKHWARWNRYGDPEFPVTDKYKSIPAEDRFWKYAKPGEEGECWGWIGPMHSQGYGNLSVNGKKMFAHRFSYKLHQGAIPQNSYVLHRCHNRICTNPDHLYVGSAQDNMMDMACAGRQAHQVILPHQAQEIRRMAARGGMQSKIAKLYGVSDTTISRIVLGKTHRYDK